jgi:hypothetical protein
MVLESAKQNAQLEIAKRLQEEEEKEKRPVNASAPAGGGSRRLLRDAMAKVNRKMKLEQDLTPTLMSQWMERFSWAATWSPALRLSDWPRYRNDPRDILAPLSVSRSYRLMQALDRLPLPPPTTTGIYAWVELAPSYGKRAPLVVSNDWINHLLPMALAAVPAIEAAGRWERLPEDRRLRQAWPAALVEFDEPLALRNGRAEVSRLLATQKWTLLYGFAQLKQGVPASPAQLLTEFKSRPAFPALGTIATAPARFPLMSVRGLAEAQRAYGGTAARQRHRLTAPGGESKRVRGTAAAAAEGEEEERAGEQQALGVSYLDTLLEAAQDKCEDVRAEEEALDASLSCKWCGRDCDWTGFASSSLLV